MHAHTKIRIGLIAVVVTALVGTIALAGCSNATTESEDALMNTNTTTETTSAYRKIDANEAQTMMDAGNVTVIDVRTPKEYADAHIPGAINIPLESIGSDKPAELTDPDADLIVYCRSGVRSKQASDKLVALGYQHVNDMGGIIDWHGDTVSGDQPGGN